MAMSPSISGGRYPNLTLQAWTIATWNGAAWVAAKGGNCNVAGASLTSITLAFPTPINSANYVLDVAPGLSQTLYPFSFSRLNGATVNGCSLAIGSNGGAFGSLNAGDSVYIGVYA